MGERAPGEVAMPVPLCLAVRALAPGAVGSKALAVGVSTAPVEGLTGRLGRPIIRIALRNCDGCPGNRAAPDPEASQPTECGGAG